MSVTIGPNGTNVTKGRDASIDKVICWRWVQQRSMNLVLISASGFKMVPDALHSNQEEMAIVYYHTFLCTKVHLFFPPYKFTHVDLGVREGVCYIVYIV